MKKFVVKFQWDEPGNKGVKYRECFARTPEGAKLLVEQLLGKTGRVLEVFEKTV